LSYSASVPSVIFSSDEIRCGASAEGSKTMIELVPQATKI
jgi:hypothetical protein